MKRTIALVLTLVLLAALFTGCQNNTDVADGTLSGVVNVYNWGEYIDPDVLAEFTAQTGIRVNYQTFDSNESLYTILKGGGADYDVIIPSDYMISRLIAEDMLDKIDFSNVPNMANVDEYYLSPEYDPTNEYSAPYLWGTVGIIYDPNVVTKPVTGWSVLFDPDYAGQILMFDNQRDAMGIALKYLGYSINTTDEIELEAAFTKLREQKPLLQAYVMDAIFDKLESGEAALGPYYAGDYITMLENNPDLMFCLPIEGSNLFVDAMCIPKGARNKRNAEAFINFMRDTDTALANADYTGYSTPIHTAFELLDDEVRDNEVQYPSPEALARCEIFVNLPAHIQEWYDNMWIELKL